MIRSLQRRLAALLVAVIGLILMGTSLAALIVSERQLSLREQAGFDAQLDALIRDVAMSRSVATAQLAKLEAEDRYIVSIYDNGQPLSFQGGWQPITPRAELIDRALKLAAGQGVTMDSGVSEARWQGEFLGDGAERYLAAVVPVNDYRSRQAVVLLKEMRREDIQRATQRKLFAGIALAALIVLSAFGWFFTAHAVRPIQAAHDRQNAFVAAASHELRTPLQVIGTSLDALADNPPDAGRFVGRIKQELSRMTALSEDLMLLTSAQGDARGRFGPVEIEALAQEAVRRHQAAASEKRIRLCFESPAALLPVVEGDALLLQRAINVLVDNAVCYTQEGGHVTISAARAARRIEISVEDDGPGIAPEHREHIFERFYRIDQSRSDRRHSGLGLSIAREITELHGGRLSFSPASPNGSRFEISLPFVNPHGR